jgi:hypothetical protein|nr:MAG TPA: hypothetical protein [Caudoviricetes sp.]
MEVKAPYCLKCPYYLAPPQRIGGKAKCKAYSNGIPLSIWVEGKNCTKKPKTGESTSKKKGVKSGGQEKVEVHHYIQ